MTEQQFQEILIFLEGAFARKFSPEAVTVAWSIFEPMNNHLVGLGARRMVEEGEEYPSPAKWLRRVKAIQAEAREDQRAAESKARLDVYHQLQMPSGESPLRTGDVLVAEAIGGDHPRYPGMGLRQILAVRELEKAGMSHEEALKEIAHRSKLAGGEQRT